LPAQAASWPDALYRSWPRAGDGKWLVSFPRPQKSLAKQDAEQRASRHVARDERRVHLRARRRRGHPAAPHARRRRCQGRGAGAAWPQPGPGPLRRSQGVFGAQAAVALIIEALTAAAPSLPCTAAPAGRDGVISLGL